jgi:hypothetical protein
MEPGESSYREERSRLPMAFGAGLIIVFILFGGVFFVTRKMHSSGPAAEVKLPFGPTEQAYSERIHFTDMHMAKATNFLNQEFTYVAGAMDVSIEFRDPFKQVILRDSEHLIGSDTAALIAGQKGTFQVSVEHLPAEWNHEYPIIRVTGLVLE